MGEESPLNHIGEVMEELMILSESDLLIIRLPVGIALQAQPPATDG